jgi:hypothetical protein
MDKAKVSQDFLYEYLKEHNFIISKLTKVMGVSKGILDGCFRHDLNRHGKPLSLSAANVERLNAALQQISAELRDSVISFGSQQMFTNVRGTTYDPGCVPAIQRLGEYFTMKAFTARVLGWNTAKNNQTISIKSSAMFGRVTADNVAKINAELLAVAGMLGGIEVEMPKTADDDESSL